MRIITLLLLLTFVLCSSLSGCGGRADLLPEAFMDTNNSPWDSYDPFAPNMEIRSTSSALAEAKGITINGFNIVALNKQNQVDNKVQNELVVNARPDSLVISLKKPVDYAGLYISYDGTKQHASNFVSERSDGISIAFESEAGLIAVGVCAFENRKLESGIPLVSISFEDGPSSVQKRASIISLVDPHPVDNLEAIDGGEEAATLGWSERNTGDYDLNSEVNLADLAAIAINFQESYVETDADYAQLEVVDGDENGEINLADIAQIAINFRSQVTGYNVYRKPLASLDDTPLPEDSDWVQIPNAGDSSKPTIERLMPQGQDFRLRYSVLDSCGEGIYAWYVVPVGPGGLPHDEGLASNIIKTAVTGGSPPDAGLSFEIMPPAGSMMNVDDEFYIGVQIAEVEGLFSANVRFEYDGSLLEFMEAESAYDTNVNLLEPPLFISNDDAGDATSPYVLLGFNATQTQGTATKDGTGFLGFFRFKVIDAATNLEAFRFPVASTHLHLWGDQYGVPIATPVLGGPQAVNAGF